MQTQPQPSLKSTHTVLLNYIANMTRHCFLMQCGAAWKTKTYPAEKNNRKCNGFDGYNGNCIGFNENYNGDYWYVMVSIGLLLFF